MEAPTGGEGECGESSGATSVLDIDLLDSDSDECEDTSATCSSSSGNVRSLLDVLQIPTPSMLARKRRVATNPPKGVKRRISRQMTTVPKSVSPQERAKQFQDEPLTVSSGRLFCSACREEVSLKSVVKLHLSSAKHKLAKEKLAHKEARERDIAQALKSYDHSFHPKGETLSDRCRLYRVKVVTCFLKAGVPLQSLIAFRAFLKRTPTA